MKNITKLSATKKVIAIVFAIVMLVSFSAVMLTANAAEEGTLVSNAITLTAGKSYTKYWTNSNCKLNCYNKITVSSRGYITFTMEKPYDDEGEIASFDYDLYDAEGNMVWSADGSEQRDTFSENYVYKIGLNKGTYYMNLDPDFYVFSYSAPIPSTYKYTFTSTDSWEVEPNNSQTNATKIELGKMYSGVYTDESYTSTYADVFSVKLTKGQKYEVKLQNFEKLDATTFIFYSIDPNGKEDYMYEDKVSGDTAIFSFTPTMTGTYYFKLGNCGNRAGIEYKIGVYASKTSISKFTATLSKTSYAYDGYAKKPTVTLKDTKGKELQKGTDYTVSYSNNTSIGTATVKITGIGSYSGTKSINFSIVPAQVTGVKASTVATTSIKLAWTKVSGAKYYKVEQSTDGKTWKAVTTTDKTSYTVSKLTAGSKYQFRVTALDSTKKIAGKVSSVLKTGTKTAAPVVTLKSSKSKTATATWKKITGASKYIVYKSTDNKKWTKVTETTKLTYDLTKLTGGKKIYVKVVAVNAYKVNSADSKVVSVTVKK